jgi:hypothetical protein
VRVRCPRTLRRPFVRSAARPCASCSRKRAVVNSSASIAMATTHCDHRRSPNSSLASCAPWTIGDGISGPIALASTGISLIRDADIRERRGSETSRSDAPTETNTMAETVTIARLRRTDVDALIDGIAGVTLTALLSLPARYAPTTVACTIPNFLPAPRITTPP